jgi:hypothetical protein
MAKLALFGAIVARLWRSFSNRASPDHKGDAVLGTAVRVLPAHRRYAKVCRVANVMRPCLESNRMAPANPNFAASIRARLLNVAKAQGPDFDWAD